MPLNHDPTAPRKKWALLKYVRDVWNPAHPNKQIARVPGFDPDSEYVGPPAREFLKAMQRATGLQVTGTFNVETMTFLLPPGIRGRVMARAHAELGETEWPPGSNWGPVAEYLRAAGIPFGAPWCAAFTYWVLTHTGFAREHLPSGPAAVESWLNFGTAKKLTKPVAKSVYGDLWIWEFGGNPHAHIGFCDEGVKGSMAWYLDGNVGANGGTVTDATRAAYQIHAVIDLVKLAAVK
jgi:hypothetical protein